MLARFTPAFPGAIGLAFLGALTVGSQSSGLLAGSLAALIAGFAGLALAVKAPEVRFGLRRQMRFGAALFGLNAASLYTLGAGSGADYVPTAVQGVVAVIGAIACLVLAARIDDVALSAASPPPVPDDDPDRTLEIDVEHTTTLAIPPAQPLRGALIAGIATSALLVLATLYWLEDAGPTKTLAAAAAIEAPSTRPEGLAPAPEPEAQPQVVAQMPAIAEPPQPASGAGAQLPTSAIAPSAARRECMAQIESARLFLQFARQSPDQADYVRATEAQIASMLGKRPVGPRTLARIAERMWELRETPERQASWWSSQFSRCESARSSGSWYVVRG